VQIRRPITQIAMIAILMVALFAASVIAQETSDVDRAFQALDPQIREVVETYLRTDCEIGEVGKALNAVLLVAKAVTPYLIAVKREGPPSPVLNDFDRGLDETWQARLEFLSTPDAQELGPESFRLMKAITKDEYFQDQQTAIQEKYRQRAALALRAIKCRRNCATSKNEEEE
jgi:hypothetical protein